MINYEKLFNALEANNLNKDSSLEDLNNVLNQLHYSEVDKKDVFGMLKSKGWFSDNNIPESPKETILMQDEPTNLSNVSSKKSLIGIVVLAIIALIGCGLVYAYIEKVGPFSLSKYSEENFSSNLLQKISQIDSASYTVSGVLEVVPRDKDAEPFILKEISNAAELKQKYYYDSERLKDASSIISRLNSLSNYSTYNASQGVTAKPYPESIKTLFDNIGTSYYSGSKSITDPATDKEYEYQTTEGGKNFLLTVNFETNDAIKAIKDYQYKATSTIIDGKKVSFTKDSYSYFYMSSEPPKPFLVTLSESMKTLPPDISVETAISASSEIKSEGMADWLFNINAEGDFGDLTYKVNVDALKEDDNYYFKINNFPSLLLFGELSSLKGKWVNISSDDVSSDDENSYSVLGTLKESIPKMEKDYKENQEKFVKFMKKAVDIADEEKLIVFRNEPRSEKIDGRQLIRYELRLKKESILPFYTKLQEEIDKDPDFSSFRDVVDQGLIDYLKSEEFEQVFDYFDENDRLIFWTDAKGFPAIIQNSMRVIPPDTATQLQDKQISVIFKVIISDINKKLNIKAPSESVPIEKIISDFEKNMGMDEARGLARDATRKADMRQIIVAQELYYNMNNAYYTNSGTSWPSAIGTFMPKIPTDPLKDTETPYIWVDNTSNNQKFCIYATLESGEWYTSSHNGNYACSDVKPTLNDCCF